MLELLAGYRVSASTVSEVNKVLDAEVGAFHRRVLSDEYVYLFLDGVRQRVVSCGQVMSKVVLVVYVCGLMVIVRWWIFGWRGMRVRRSGLVF